jgi:hypothetical protein
MDRPGQILRYLLTIIPYLLKNVRVALNRLWFSFDPRGPVTVNGNLFRFDLFRSFVGQGLRFREFFFYRSRPGRSSASGITWWNA